MISEHMAYYVLGEDTQVCPESQLFIGMNE